MEFNVVAELYIQTGCCSGMCVSDFGVLNVFEALFLQAKPAIMVYYGTTNNILPMKKLIKLVLAVYILCSPQSCNGHDRQSDTHESLTQ